MVKQKMTYMLELTKANKKAARQIIEFGLQKEFKTGLRKAAEIIKEWETTSGDNRKYYQAPVLQGVLQGTLKHR